MASTNTKNSKIDKIVGNNQAKVNNLRWPEAKYNLYISFKGVSVFDLNAPMGFLLRKSTLNRTGMTRKRVENMECGSGFGMNGLRDYHFLGSEDEIWNLLRMIADCPFRIHSIQMEIASPENYEI